MFQHDLLRLRFQTTSSDLRLLCRIGRFLLDRFQQRYQQLFHQSLEQRSFYRLGVFAFPGFGSNFSDHMVLIDWNPEHGWHDHRIVGYAPFTLDPASAVFHYAQEAFEGLKAYAHEDGSIWRFRADVNAARFQRSARRLALPELSVDDFLTGIDRLVEVEDRKSTV